MWESISQFLSDLWDDLAEFFLDVFLSIVGAVLSGIASVISALPAPDFMMNYSAGDYIPQDIAWFLVMSDFPQAMGIIGTAMLFRFLRRVLTLGIW